MKDGEASVRHKTFLEEAETKAAAATAVALNTKARAAFEGQSSDHIGNIDALTEAIAVLENGMTGEGFLQDGGGVRRREVKDSEKACDSERASVLSFL